MTGGLNEANKPDKKSDKYSWNFEVQARHLHCALKECLWHLNNPKASESMPIDWEQSRNKVLAKATEAIKNYESLERSISDFLDEQQ